MPDKGWAWVTGARKAHFFVNGRSLCGNWSFFGRATPDDGRDGPWDCKKCQRKVHKLRESGEI